MTEISLRMESPMNAVAMPPLPRRAAVAREQFRAVGLSVRREALACTGVLALVSTVMLWDRMHHHFSSLEVSPGILVPAAFVALLLPMAMWKGEGPGRRAYHHAMPVDHGAHAVTRTLAGLVWLFAAIGAYIGWLGAMMLVTGGYAADVQVFRWMAPLAGAVVLYLLGSALALRAAHPWRWLAGAAVGYAFLDALSPRHAPIPPLSAVDVVLTGKYGLTTVLSGLSPVLHQRAGEIDGRWYSWYSHEPVASVWMTAVWLWLAVAVALFVWSAYRQPER